MRMIVRIQVALLLAFLSVPAPARSGAPAPRPLLSSKLQGEMEFRLEADGSFRILAAGSDDPLLQGNLAAGGSAGRSRRSGEAKPFFKLTSEGVPGGLRGFAAGADDDRDGRVDEDPLDGLDNDQDGLVDEDFAAIGDTMGAMRLQRAGLQFRQEIYRWAYPHLQPAVFLNIVPDPGADGIARLRLEAAGPWVEADVRATRHSLAGKAGSWGGQAMVTTSGTGTGSEEDGACAAGSETWLGVMILNEMDAGGSPGPRMFTEDGVLEIDLTDRPLSLVVATGDSWLQLAGLLAEARRVYEGVADPVSGRRARWIVPALCSPCRLAEPPAFAAETTPGGDLVLRTELAAGQSRLVDPDLFRIMDLPLGHPSRLVWRGADGAEQTVVWDCGDFGALVRGGEPVSAPWMLLPALQSHEDSGRLELWFDDLDPDLFDTLDTAAQADGPVALAGRYGDGRTLRGETTLSRAQVPGSAGPTDLAGAMVDPDLGRRRDDPFADRSRLTLSPELLNGWPNPFRDRIQIRFKVPASVGEAFVWDDDKDRPEDSVLQAPVPWEGGQPQASVKIYSVTGQELMTLHTGQHSPGEFTVQWDGSDSHGRPVASGTYFCKLQLDDWSATRLIVYLR
ncbi:hypothetical protein KJ682_13550 [bacterium]|nr:hypothetical protein [bacterium]